MSTFWPRRGAQSMNFCAALPMFELNAPANPLSPATTIDQDVFLFALDQQRMENVAGLLVVEIGAPTIETSTFDSIRA